MSIKAKVTITQTVTREVSIEFPIGEVVTPRCPSCGRSGQLRIHMPAVFAIDPSGRGRGYNPVPVSVDDPERRDPAFCIAEGCEWTGQFMDLFMGQLVDKVA